MAKQTRIQVAAPEGGIIYDIGHAKTPWQKYSDLFKGLLTPRLVWPMRNGRYRRPIPKTHKGKKAVRAAKRAKVAAMKAAGHFRGDNREFA